jgi:hypothetical protein
LVRLNSLTVANVCRPATSALISAGWQPQSTSFFC